MKSIILELENLINSEIEEYKKIEKLYIDKREVLTRTDSEALMSIDSLILDKVQTINNLSVKREEITKKMDIGSSSMSDIIDFLKTQDMDAAFRFEKKKTIINDLAQSLTMLENVNLELVKHGLRMNNKIMDIILKEAGIQNQEYNEYGKNVTNDNLDMSSIVEEA